MTRSHIAKLIYVFVLVCIGLAEAEAAQIGRITAEVNFREGPSRSAQIIGRLDAGTEVGVISRTPAGWYFVRHGGRRGFVHENYVRIEHPQKPSYVKAVAGFDLKPKEIVLVVALVSFFLVFLIVRRYVSFPKLATVLATCALWIILLDVAFKLGFLYSLIFVSLALFVVLVVVSRGGRTPSSDPRLPTASAFWETPRR